MDAASNGLGKLLPKGITAKRRRHKASSISSSNDDGARSAPVSRTTTNSGASLTDFDNNNNHQQHQQGGDSNNASNNGHDEQNDGVPYDSDPDSPVSRPAFVSPHPSHVGYLTTSSPLVQAAHKPEPQPQSQSQSQSQPNSQPQTQSQSQPFGNQTIVSARSSTFSHASVDSTDSAASSLKRSESLAAPHQLSKKPSTSGRLRDVFRSKKPLSDKSETDDRSPLASAADQSAGPVPSIPPLDPESPKAAATPAQVQQNRRLSRGQKVPLIKPPVTPPSASTDATTPVIVNTPPTPTDPVIPTPGRAVTASPRGTPDASPGNMISQRRSRAGSGSIGPSKLSTITPAPLTPTPENGPATPGNPAATFFSSMFSAVQNTANSLSNTIQNSAIAQNANKNHPANNSANHTPVKEHQEREDNVEVESSSEAQPDQSMDSKEPAVKTLGMGDLSLSQLGILDTANHAATPVSARFAESESRARSESAPVDAHTTGPSVHEDPVGRPRSLYETALAGASATGERTPPAGSVYEGKTEIHRSGSIRSVVERRRHRGSSAATGGTIAAAIAAANSSFANPAAVAMAPKLTGFAVATKRRNRDFHSLFKSVPDDDYLIEDYSCALQREILAHGRLYISEGHLCFSSNILGWVTTLVMSFDEIVSVEKRSTALVFKNGLEISTLHAKHIFASFASRDTTYDLIIKIWKLGHPHLQSSLNGVRLEEPGGDRTEKIETESVSAVNENDHSVSGSDVESEVGDDDDDVYDEDEDGDDGQEASQATETQATEPFPGERTITRKASAAVGPAAAEKVDESAPSGAGVDFPGPAVHAPTECGDAATHYDKILGDDVVPAPLGKVYSLLFGPASAAWMGKWLTVEQKCTDLQMEDKRALSDDNKTRSFSYIKPLTGSIGPRQTKCMVTEQIDHFDLEKAVNVTVSTQNPDVPSGNIFVVKTKYCLSWAEGNATRVQVNCTIEWSGKSWLKGAIERGANDGQTQYCKDIFIALKTAVSSRPRSGTVTNGAAPKIKKRGRKSKSALASNPASDVEGVSKTSAQQGWGLFEPLHPLFGPVVDTFRPIVTGNVVYGLLVGLLVASWFGFGANRQAVAPYGRDMGYVGYPQRLAAYEEMWRKEESDLWDWIEERAGLDRLGEPRMQPRKRVVEPRTVEEKLREAKMDEREIKEALRVTEEHLQVLKSVVNNKKAPPAA
ncbi:hypothetical protein B0T24DRAFT_294094 [Lasiosphaeria ovina]|uniref:VASt domain-containing protein n=1 Tax=Lasiosphaeria ovina TaxID=92902 RepID=A0AAE0N9H9_9PEZI|nr:hypothetical protein B0T24DRAFT_294094 [Lasiosphaeria ovina]